MADGEHSEYRVAVASSDGETVNRHYGRAEKFFVYTVDDEEGYDLLEERNANPVCMGGSHMKAAMDESVRRFADCRYVVASRIGSGAAQSLTAAGIVGMELPGSIEEAIVKVWKYNRVQGLFNIE